LECQFHISFIVFLDFRDGVVLFQYLSEHFNLTTEHLDTLYQYAKFQYECGNYSGASQYLYFYRVLVHDDDKNAASAIWGKLACEILTQNWDAALEDINRLKESIDNDVSFYQAIICYTLLFNFRFHFCEFL